MGKYRKFTPEYREEAVQMVLATSRPIAEVARELGLNESTLSNWVSKYRVDHPASEDLNISESGRLLRQGTVSERYAFIAVERANRSSVFPVVKMCDWLLCPRRDFMTITV